ncbi:hypothetical protein TVAG_456430 [Trichomonas vaginalis G3]|uniref:Surface antigen BspA-like n=1 Tax=Trichomonas vaginalis (strain ATCC PRA-98 / G3) TaxID=412133 RepID=A2DBW7_TRIV3|nr:regulation of response to stimulus [Trichomonas vaginalis G3]EAY22008.1 hypothetical protein TVAG_456430 [Trichomonas vaginalis G3]KAI5525367.1 regulation of response to stimulus [Trichomonas vaginalis G3]|eukprot:XP_001582994.1 hypothetical protein [Trichomonas vaginalis G3]
MTVINTDTFSNAYKLRNLILPPTIQAINSNAFQWTNIETFTVPRDTHTISEYGLHNCVNLSTFIIDSNSSLMNIKFAAFSGCKSLATIICNDSMYFTVENFALFNKNKTVLVVFPPGCPCKFFSVPITIREIEAGHSSNAGTLSTFLSQTTLFNTFVAMHSQSVHL